jgi:hypothetical protein
LITILSVLYRNRPFFDLNYKLTRALNTGTEYRWLVADNESGGEDVGGEAGITLIGGVERTATRDSGSLHHARALQECLARVDTRFALAMDPDFFVLQRNWLERIVAHVTKNDIAFFGAGWHPRWTYQYRYFPCVHFMLIDLDKAPAGEIDFLPSIDGDMAWHLVNSDRVPIPGWLRPTLKIGRIRDTGWQVYRKYRDHPSIRHETLTPSFRPPATARVRLETRLGALLPDRLRLVPGRAEAFTEKSFLEEIRPAAWALGWEEFFWRDEPFAVHLRSVGRAANSQPELSVLRDLLEGFGLPRAPSE